MLCETLRNTESTLKYTIVSEPALLLCCPAPPQALATALALVNAAEISLPAGSEGPRTSTHVAGIAVVAAGVPMVAGIPEEASGIREDAGGIDKDAGGEIAEVLNA